MVERPGHAHGRRTGAVGHRRAVPRARHRAAAGRVRVAALPPWPARLLHATQRRPAVPDAVDDRPGRHRARAHRPDGARRERADHARLVAAEQGGRPAGLPALRGRHRGVDRARHGRRDRRGRRRPDRPRALLPHRLAARRHGVLLRASHRPLARARGRAAVPPARLPAPGRRRPRYRRRDLRRRPRDHQLLRRLRQPRRALAADLEPGGHRAAQRPVAGRPRRVAARVPRARRRCRSVSTPRPASHLGRDGRAYVFTDRDAPRGRLARDRSRRRRRTRTGSTCCRRTPRPCSRTSRSSTATSSSGRCSSRPGRGTASAS